MRALFPSSSAVASLLNHISHVVLVCACKQVIRVYTSLIIAAVTHKQPFRDWAFVQFVREAVHQSRLGIDAHCSVSMCGNCPSPPPACIGLIDSSPEAVDSVIAPSGLELCFPGWPINSRVMVFSESSRHMRGRDRRDHGATSALTRYFRHRQNSRAELLFFSDLGWVSSHEGILTHRPVM